MKNFSIYALTLMVLLSIGACKKTDPTPSPTSPTTVVSYTLTTTPISISNFVYTEKDSSGAYINKLVITAPDKSVMTFRFIGNSPTTYDLSVAGYCTYVDASGKLFLPYNGQLTIQTYTVSGTKHTISGVFSYQGKASDNSRVNINNGQLTNVSTQ